MIRLSSVLTTLAIVATFFAPAAASAKTAQGFDTAPHKIFVDHPDRHIGHHRLHRQGRS